MEQSRQERSENISEDNRERIRRLYEKRLHERKLKIYEEALEEAIRREKMGMCLTIKFSVKYETKFGQDLRVVGNIKELGDWDVEKSLSMTWTEGSFWTVSVKILPTNNTENIEYKYILVDNNPRNSYNWEPGKNHSVQINKDSLRELQLTDAWGGGGLY
ncbi:glucan 1 [Cryptosporidium bovis]|uniref:glucan 1 n=1 Tax=Cryptosporidium bovis TaxID=310047 RepID=UPI00351A2871|nr:glucan 1 [Cryptosporidium bovis]